MGVNQRIQTKFAAKLGKIHDNLYDDINFMNSHIRENMKALDLQQKIQRKEGAFGEKGWDFIKVKNRLTKI